MKLFLALLAFLLVPLTATADELYKPVTTHIVSIGSASKTMATGVTDFVEVVRVVGTVSSHVAIGVSPVTASASDGGSVYLPAGETAFFRVRQGNYIAVIQDSTSGTLYITEMTK